LLQRKELTLFTVNNWFNNLHKVRKIILPTVKTDRVHCRSVSCFEVGKIVAWTVQSCACRSSGTC
jgi:hypothetical protein